MSWRPRWKSWRSSSLPVRQTGGGGCGTWPRSGGEWWSAGSLPGPWPPEIRDEREPIIQSWSRKLIIHFLTTLFYRLMLGMNRACSKISKKECGNQVVCVSCNLLKKEYAKAVKWEMSLVDQGCISGLGDVRQCHTGQDWYWSQHWLPQPSELNLCFQKERGI